MKSTAKTKQQLIDDLDILRARVKELEQAVDACRQAEASALASEERFRHAIQETPFPIMIHAEDGQVIAINETWTELTGYTHRDIPTIADWTEKAYGERHRLVKAEIDRLYGLDKKVKEGEYAITTNRGMTRIWDCSSAPLGSLPDGRRLVISVAMDITFRKWAEEELLRQNEYLMAIQETMLDLLSRLDLDSLLENIVMRAGLLMGTKAGYLDMIDPATGQLEPRVGLGALAERLNHHVGPGEDVAGRVLQTGKPLVVEDYDTWLGRVADFRRGLIRSVIGVPLLSNQQVVGVLGLAYEAGTRQIFSQEAVDVLSQFARLAAIAIENARLVRALRRSNAELQARNEELDAFGHTVAHDLKNPLSHLIGFSYLLADEESGLSDEDTRHLAVRIEQIGLKMDNIIEELMLLAGLRSADVQMEALDMAEVLDEALSRLGHLIKDAHAEIIALAVWPTAIGYAPWVEEVWINYISNAIKYGGQPLRVELGASQQEGKVRFWVRDNGRGLTPAEQSKLFVPLERLDRVHCRGHGLGLSIVRRIMERMDGEVGVESRGVAGEGSTFSFTLPAMPSNEVPVSENDLPMHGNKLPPR